jgi:hypothetical protein
MPSNDDWARAALVCREVAELPDRTSPAENADFMLVTGDELQPIVAEALASVRRYWQAEIHKLCPDSTFCRDGMLYDNDGKAMGACEWRGHAIGGHT